MSDATQTPSPTSKLAVAAFVLSLIPCSSPLGVILGVVALLIIHKHHGVIRGRGFALAAIIVPLVALPLTILVVAPAYRSFSCGAKQSEAQFNLKAIANLERVHHGDHAAYTDDLATLGFTPGDTVVRYRYQIVEAGPDRYRAEAVGLDDMTGDKWTIDDTGTLTNVANVCE